VPGERIELPTNGLQNRCSTAELTRQAVIYRRFLCDGLPPKAICYRFATQLLVFCFPFVYGRLQRRVNQSGGIGLHIRQHMAVEVERDPDLAMA
jgi:hypothetical protein